MSEESCRKRLCDEGTCPVCRDYFTDPVTLDCGHNFCSACINGVREFSSRRPECPLCKGEIQTKKLRPNTQLANMVEIAQDLSNLLKHRGVCSVEEAEKEFAKDQINRLLNILMKKKLNILNYKAKREKSSHNYLKEMEEGRKMTTAAFRKLHEFLDEQEKNLLAQTEVVEKEIGKRRDENLAIISGELSSLDSLMQELEEKLKQSSNELLQISGDILERCKKKESYEEWFPASLMWRIHDRFHMTTFTDGIMNQFKESLVSGLQPQEANVKLDPISAHPLLILSEDLKSMRYEYKHLDLPNDPEIYEETPCVLGQEGFLGGRHFWDVAVSNEEEWSVGVAIQSVNSKDDGSDGMKLVEMGMWDGEYRVYNFSNKEEPESYVNSRQELKKIRVIVNYGAREVGFYNADTGEKLTVEFINVPFDGEVVPYFSVSRKGHLTLCPQDNASRESGNQPHQLPPAAFA